MRLRLATLHENGCVIPSKVGIQRWAPAFARVTKDAACSLGKPKVTAIIRQLEQDCPCLAAATTERLRTLSAWPRISLNLNAH